jgi:hypothetical protein
MEVMPKICRLPRHEYGSPGEWVSPLDVVEPMMALGTGGKGQPLDHNRGNQGGIYGEELDFPSLRRDKDAQIRACLFRVDQTSEAYNWEAGKCEGRCIGSHCWQMRKLKNPIAASES